MDSIFEGKKPTEIFIENFKKVIHSLMRQLTRQIEFQPAKIACNTNILLFRILPGKLNFTAYEIRLTGFDRRNDHWTVVDVNVTLVSRFPDP